HVFGPATCATDRVSATSRASPFPQLPPHRVDPFVPSASQTLVVLCPKVAPPPLSSTSSSTAGQRQTVSGLNLSLLLRSELRSSYLWARAQYLIGDPTNAPELDSSVVRPFRPSQHRSALH